MKSQDRLATLRVSFFNEFQKLELALVILPKIYLRLNFIYFQERRVKL